MHSNLRSKLQPENLPGIAPSTAGILGMLLNENHTTPRFEAITIGLEGRVFLTTEGDEPQQVYIGPLSNVQADLMKAAALAGLTSVEFNQLEGLFALHTNGAHLYH